MRPLRALWGSTHPGPTLVVTGLALALGIAVGLEPWRLALLSLAVFFGQLSIGLSNDAIDAPRDRAVGRTDKPIARGDVSERAAWTAAIATLALALVLSAPLGFGMLAAHAIFLASAWSYNAGLKSTPFSIVPFLVSFGIFPSLATLAAPEPGVAAPWGWIAGAALGAAVHLTNVLPDLDDDRRTGIQGLPHRLGLRPSIVITWVALLLGAVAVTIGVATGPTGIPVFAIVGLLVSLIIAVIGLVLALRRGVGRWLFRLVIAAALVDVVMLVLAGTRMLA